MAEPCPVQAGAEDRYQGGPERLENYLPCAPWGPAELFWGWGVWVMLGLCPLQTR